MTFGFFPSMTATQEFVVPRSMPITFAIPRTSLFLADRSGPDLAPAPQLASWLGTIPYHRKTRREAAGFLPYIGGSL
jgi:hypothetical protein